MIKPFSTGLANLESVLLMQRTEGFLAAKENVHLHFKLSLV